MAEERRGGGREWPRVLGLFGVVLVTSVFVSPGVVIGVPLVLLLAARGFGNLLSAVVTGLVILIVVGGRTGLADGLWYSERAWAVLVGGWFLALTLLVPGWRLTARAIGSVAGAVATAALSLAARSGAWAALDSAVTRAMEREVDATLQAVRALGGPEMVSPEMVTMAQDVAAAQASVFPALLGLESLAALGVAWWARAKLLGEPDRGLAPLRDFRFNDHLVWVLVLGLLLLVAQSGGALPRVGSNAVIFMGALYALRGAAVFVFVSGGVSVFAAMVIGLLVVLMPPVVLGTAALIGIGDTWFDVRRRTADQAV